jgi:putative transposase
MNVLRGYGASGKCRLHDFVIMPNHLHLLLAVASGMTIEKAKPFFKGGFSGSAGSPKLAFEGRESLLQHRE